MSSILDLLQSQGGMQGGPQGPQQDQPESGDEVDALKQAIQALHQFVELASDDIDRQTALQCYAKLQQILASEQKEKEAAMGTTPAHRHLRKQANRANGGGY